MKFVISTGLFIFILFFILRCERMNGPVEILSLNTSDSLVEAGGLLSLKCVAQDEDKDDRYLKAQSEHLDHLKFLDL